MIDKDLFLHDLSVVAILKNEAPYLKEWLDYHLAAGVDHFYLYDNESSDNQIEVAAPYIKAGLVDYISAPGKVMQMIVYNDAFKRFKFQSRYLAFIDGDEFIFPKTGQSIVELVDEILSHDPNAAGLAINWQCFGSNGEEKADYSRGVLERFTRRAPTDWVFPIKENNLPGGNTHVKTIANPRIIDFLALPHSAIYFGGAYAINENGGIVNGPFNNPITAEKIVINHYNTKSREEYTKKINRGRADYNISTYNYEEFDSFDRNEEFDDGILKYRAERAENFLPPDKSRADEWLLNALMKNLSPVLLPNTPPEFYAGKLETFLTCRAVAAYLKPRITNTEQANFFEETATIAIVKTLSAGTGLAEVFLFLRELPNLLRLPYTIVKELREEAMKIISQLMNLMYLNSKWKDYVELDYLRELLKE